MTLERPVFVVGLARGGTSLMRELLSAHSRLHIGGETRFLNQAAVSLKGKDPDAAEFEQLWSRMFPQYERVLGIDPARLRARLERSSGRVPSLEAIFSALVLEEASLYGKPRAGEKSPGHAGHLSTLFAWYPDARVVWMIRDPRAYVASAMRRHWAQRTVRANARAWAGSVRAARHWGADPRVIVVRYERLAREPGEVLRAVCAHIDEPFEDTMLRSQGAAELLDWNSSFDNSVPTAGGAVSTEPADRWRTTLSLVDIAGIEHTLSGRMNRWGYRLTTSRLTRLTLGTIPFRIRDGLRRWDPKPEHPRRKGPRDPARLLKPAGGESGAKSEPEQ